MSLIVNNSECIEYANITSVYSSVYFNFVKEIMAHTHGKITFVYRDAVLDLV